jgi:hypothetical protein
MRAWEGQRPVIGAAKQMLLAVAALLLSAGHAACACLSSAQNSAPIVQTSMDDAGHAHHHRAGDDATISPAPHSNGCDHCESVTLAGDGTSAAGSLPTWQKSYPIAPSPAIVSTPKDVFGALSRRLHWAASPRRTPVSLKIRLRN